MTSRYASVMRDLDRVIGLAKCRPSWAHSRISKIRADHDRVTKAEFVAEIRRCRLGNFGQVAELARVLDVSEGAVRHWLDDGMPKALPPRWAIDVLREKFPMIRRVVA